MLSTKRLCNWPITFLQEHLLGICTGDFIVIGCDSGVGKSTLSRIITRGARDDGCPVVLYSLENRPDTFVTEEVMLEYCRATGSYPNMREFEMDHTEHPEKYVEYRQAVYERSKETNADGLPMLVVHEQVAKGDWTITRLVQSMRAEIAQGYRLFIVDHLDVLGSGDELADTKRAMDELWSLVQQHNIAIVSFSQIVKGCHALCPSHDDLRGHKSKVHKSTVIITLGKHEYGYYAPPIKFPNAKPTYVRIAKSRSTSTACAVCFFNGGDYLDTYNDVLCDAPGNFIDGMTREKLQKFKQKKDERVTQWD